MNTELLKWALLLAGTGQVVIALLYPFVRYRVLNWFTDLNNLKPLNAAIARTYGYYIQGTNFFFGALSLLLVNDLLIPSRITIALVGFMAVYWWGRISFQLKDYSFKELTATKNVTTGIWTMNLLITFLALTYTILFVHLFSQ